MSQSTEGQTIQMLRDIETATLVGTLVEGSSRKERGKRRERALLEIGTVKGNRGVWQDLGVIPEFSLPHLIHH